MRHLTIHLINLLFLILFCAPVSQATIIFVPGEYTTIQAGINAASDGDTVLVADGTYTGLGNTDITFLGKSILVTSKNGPFSTIIDCNGSSSHPHRGFIFEKGESSSSVLQGFTIENGWQVYGGCIHCYNSAPTIKGNVIRDNYADIDGGGIVCWSASPTIESNDIVGNSAYNGGGIACDNSSPSIVSNTIADNGAWNRGGGVFCTNESFSTIERNTIRGNVALYEGGGIACEWVSSPTIDGNRISMNAGFDFGGGIYCFYSSPTIKNNTIDLNTTDQDGGGIACTWGSTPGIEGNTITGNSAGNGGGIACNTYSTTTVLNSILWEDYASIGHEIYVESGSGITVTYSNIQDGWSGEGNIDIDPMFVFSDKRDYRLLWGSPCIDSGHPTFLDPDGTRSDMGAHYFDQSKPLTIYLTPDTTTILRPGELGVTYTLINIEADTWTFGLRSDVYLATGKPFPGNPIVGPIKITLSGEETIQRHATHQAPEKSPLGTYTYTSRIGLPPDQLIDQDSFEFDVVEE